MFRGLFKQKKGGKKHAVGHTAGVTITAAPASGPLTPTAPAAPESFRRPTAHIISQQPPPQPSQQQHHHLEQKVHNATGMAAGEETVIVTDNGKRIVKTVLHVPPGVAPLSSPPLRSPPQALSASQPIMPQQQQQQQQAQSQSQFHHHQSMPQQGRAAPPSPTAPSSTTRVAIDRSRLQQAVPQNPPFYQQHGQQHPQSLPQQQQHHKQQQQQQQQQQPPVQIYELGDHSGSQQTPLNQQQQQQQQQQQPLSRDINTQGLGEPTYGVTEGVGGVGNPNVVTRELVKKFIADIWNRGELELIPDVVSPSIRFNSTNGFDRVGHDGLARMVNTIREALDEYHCEIHSMVVEGNKAFCRLRFTGKHIGPLMGFEPTGKVVAWMGATEFTCQNGKILKVWELGDVKNLEDQLQGVAHDDDEEEE